MIGRIRGTVIEKQPPDLLLEASGVGYEIQVPMTSFYQLPALGEEAVLYTHFVVREDAQLLFGFVEKHERALFRELIKANGVGPKLALTILSGMSAKQFMQCVTYEDVSTLVKLPGVGKKTAERLVVELRDKLKKLESLDLGSDVIPTESGVPVGDTHVAVDDAREEAVSALIALGYKPNQAGTAVKAAAKEGMSSEEIIREALRSMV